MNADPRPLPEVQWLYAGAPCGLLLTETDGSLLGANQTFCNWTGYATEELVGKRTLQSLLSVGGRIFHQTHWAPLLHMQGSVAEVKLEVVCRDGQQLPMLLNAVRREIDGKAFHQIALIVVADRHKYERALLDARKRADASLISEQRAQAELRQAQARLQLAIDSAQLMVWEASLDQPGHRSYDPDVARLLGRPGPAPIDQRSFEAALSVDDRKREAQAFAAALLHPGGLYACSFCINGVDGVQRFVNSTGQGEFDGDGRMLRIVGVLQDVTQASRQRAQAEERALFAEHMVGIVSHDLRNPLAVIAMSHAVLDRNGANAAQRTHLDRITRSVKRSQRMISDLLDFTVARLGAGFPVRLASVDLPQVIRHATDDLRSAFPQRTLVAEGTGTGECFADADRIVQLVGNLVSNAISYGAADSPVRIRWSIDDGQCTIEVHNDGPPIDSETIAGLFQPMKRQRDPHQPNSGRSVGLGLFIVSEIARAHGGSVTVESTAEAGTRFTVRVAREGTNHSST